MYISFSAEWQSCQLGLNQTHATELGAYQSYFAEAVLISYKQYMYYKFFTFRNHKTKVTIIVYLVGFFQKETPKGECYKIDFFFSLCKNNNCC